MSLPFKIISVFETCLTYIIDSEFKIIRVKVDW